MVVVVLAGAVVVVSTGAVSGGAAVVVAGCGCALKEYGHLLGDESGGGAEFADKCRDVSEFLAAEGLTATPAP